MTFTGTIMVLSFIGVIVAFFTGVGIGLRMRSDDQSETENNDDADGTLKVHV